MILGRFTKEGNRRGIVLGSALALVAVATAATSPLWATDPPLDPLLLGIAAVLCAASSLEVMAGGSHAFHSNLVFFLCGAVLL
ncbi:MAG: hypothetical protein M3389_13145, partial [Actinomycetota bacterium]|nr:hypothetical protein [Actinomycetota bacterium]